MAALLIKFDKKIWPMVRRNWIRQILLYSSIGNIIDNVVIQIGYVNFD